MSNEREIEAGLAPTPGYRYADVVGDELHVAGQVPNDAHGDIVAPCDAAVQARQCLQNLDVVLATHGFDRTHVCRVVVYVVGDDLQAAWAAVRDELDGDVPPATLLGVARLGYPDQLVEIDVTVRR